MKNFIFIFVVALILLGSTTQANAATGGPLITPDSFFWRFKLLGEKIELFFEGWGGKEAKADYVTHLIFERTREIKKMEDDGETDFKLYNNVTAEELKLRDKYRTLLSEIEEDKRLEVLRPKLNIHSPGDYGLFFYEDNPEMGYSSIITKQMADVRKQVLEAQKNGNEKEEARLMQQLKDLKQGYDDSRILLRNWQEYERQNLVETANMLSGADKIKHDLDWAEEYRKKIDNTSKLPEYQSSQDLFKNAQKTIDNFENDLKKISLDNVDNFALDGLLSNATNDLNNTARAIWQKNQDEELAKRLPQEKEDTPQTKQAPPPQPQKSPAQQENKPVLKTIPSETVNTDPLLLLGPFNGLEGQVGTPFSFKFDAMDGLPPYHFRLDTMGGFPPMGIMLWLDGYLKGTPSIEGTSRFRVCVVDTAGISKCDTFTMTVKKKSCDLKKLKNEALNRCFAAYSSCVDAAPEFIEENDRNDPHWQAIRACDQQAHQCECQNAGQIAPTYFCSAGDVQSLYFCQ